MQRSNFVIYFLTLGLGISLTIIFYRYKNLTKNYYSLKFAQDLNQMILSSFPEAWCYWSVEGSLFQCSYNLRKLLGLELTGPISLKDLSKVLGDSPFSPFQKALSHLSDFGGEFQLTIPFYEQELYLDVQGQALNSKPLKESISFDFIHNKTNVILLHFKDITKALIEKDFHQNQQKKRLKEIEILKILADNIPLYLWYRNSQGHIQYCNIQYAQALETTFSKILAENIELIDFNQPYCTNELAKKALLTNNPQFMTAHKVVKGERRLLEIGEIPIKMMNITVGYALDITPLETAENERQKSVDANKDVLHYISVPIAIYDEETKLVFFNQAYLKLFNFDENWLCTQPTYSEVLENLRERRKLPEYSNFLDYKHRSLSLFKNLLQPTHELLHLPEGQILRTVIAPHPQGGLVFLFDDMTDKLSLERGYNTLVAVQKETLDHLYEGLAVFGTDNRLRLSNPPMAKIWGLKEEEIPTGRHINEILQTLSVSFIDAQENRTWRKQIIKLISSRTAYKGTLTLKGDKKIDYTYVPLPDGSNLLTFVDVSDRWRFEESVKDHLAKEEGKESIKFDFICHLSHELRSPLSTINGFIEILLKQYFGPLNQHQHHYCQSIADSSNRLTSLVNDMTKLAHIEGGRLTLNYNQVDVDKFLKDTVIFASKIANEQNIQLLAENFLNVKKIEIDEGCLKHALFNILKDSIRFISPQGRVILTLDKHPDKEFYFVLTIEDSGIGVASQSQPTNREKYTDINHHMIASLELQLAKRLITLHKGEIHFEKSIHGGTRIVCSLPIYQLDP